MLHLLYHAHNHIEEQKEMKDEFQKRADKAYYDYHNTSKTLPRKKKKEMRKKCRIDYDLYLGMISWMDDLGF